MKKIFIKSAEEIERIAEGGQLLKEILLQTAARAKPGVSTLELNDFAESQILRAGGTPSFKNYGPKSNPYPTALCTSVNSVVVHGIPSPHKILKGGDIISLDLGMKYQNLYTDTAITVGVGSISRQAQKLIEVTKKSLDLAISEVRAEAKVGDLSHAIQSTAEAAGFSVVRDLVGHGVGYDVHEDPPIPCYGKKGRGPELAEGMVIAIEPMLCEHEYFLKMENDGWTIATADGGLAAHFEHTVAVTAHGARILT